MLFQPYFAERISKLRTSYNLSYNQMAKLINIKSKANIQSWELQKSIPSFDMFNNIINFFAVSMDWLVGCTNEPYNENFILIRERELLHETFIINQKEISLLPTYIWAINDYMDENLRQKTFSLPIRANIIFLLNIYIAFEKAKFINDLAIYESNVSIFAEQQQLYKALLEPTVFGKDSKNRQTYSQQLHLLLSQKQTEPIFIIEDDDEGTNNGTEI